MGSGTTLVEAKLLNRNAIGVDINPQSVSISETNLQFQCDTSSKIYTRFTNKYSWQNNNDYFDITNGTINYKKLIASNETSYLVSQIIYLLLSF